VFILNLLMLDMRELAASGDVRPDLTRGEVMRAGVISGGCAIRLS
jgi:hypothetical protein